VLVGKKEQTKQTTHGTIDHCLLIAGTY